MTTQPTRRQLAGEDAHTNDERVARTAEKANERRKRKKGPEETPRLWLPGLGVSLGGKNVRSAGKGCYSLAWMQTLYRDELDLGELVLRNGLSLCKTRTAC
jgi:hypothetical protein